MLCMVHLSPGSDNVCAVMLLPRARDGPHSQVGSYCVCTYHGVQESPSKGGPEILKGVVHLSGRVGPRAKSWEKGEGGAKGRQQKEGKKKYRRRRRRSMAVDYFSDYQDAARDVTLISNPINFRPLSCGIRSCSYICTCTYTIQGQA